MEHSKPLLLCCLGALLVLGPPVTLHAEDDELCLSCHDLDEDPSLAEDGLGVAGNAWWASVHAEMGVTCDTCHEGKDDYPHEEGATLACTDCHDDAGSELERSVHGLEMARDGASSPWPEENACVFCHGTHDVRAVSDPESRAHYQGVAILCGECHGDLEVVQPFGLSTDQLDSYQRSVHGLSVLNGTAQDGASGDGVAENGTAADPADGSAPRAAVCTDCHGAHDVLLARHPESRINPFNIADTCGTCHPRESEDYIASVHGVAFEHGVSASPNCTDCHGIHSIKMVPDGDATPLEAHLVRTTCVRCHESEALMSEYGVASERVSSYQATYHGLALKRGTTAVADCASCHGIHAIFPSSDPRSSVASENLEATCGTCHPRATEEFTKNPVHFVTGGEPTTDVIITRWVRRIYWFLLVAVLGGMLLHNGIIVSFWLRRKWRHERTTERLRRFSPWQVVQHMVLFVTFTVLAVTGFVIAYPDFWASRLLEALGLSEPLRWWTHRVAALALMAMGLMHVAWLSGTAYGRAELARIAPRWRDLRDVVRNLRFHLGSAESPPRFDKYDYPAKLEYWAVVWGTIIMGVTGLVLWLPVLATSFLPYWIVKVSEVIHLFEAWLATLAILIFHFFYVIGHPEVYPLSLAMVDGKMTRDEAASRHPAWLAACAPPEVEVPATEETSGENEEES